MFGPMATRVQPDVLPAEDEVRAVATVADAIRLLRVPATVWEAFLEQVGNPGQELRVVAALPAHIVVQGIGQAQVAGVGLSATEAAHVRLVWRVARMAMYLKKGGDAALFEDVDPWAPSDNQRSSAQVLGHVSKGSGLKEKVLKMSALVDQADESELVPPDLQTAHS